MAKRLDVGAILSGTVSKMDTGSSMQVRDIALDLLDESPDNSYAQTGIDELAESISVIGVQQPLVVQALDGGRYQVIAGHRRRNALALLGRATAPCIVLSADLDPALRTLILHWTNTLTRGGAGLRGDALAGAAREIEHALLDLKKRGAVELPGKLRSYVAELLSVSEAALARAKAIEGHLIAPLLDVYHDKRFNDAVAYELSQCEPELQEALNETYRGHWYALETATVKAYRKVYAAGFAPLTCPAVQCVTKPCIGTDKRAAAVKRGECPGCCHECDKSTTCTMVCGEVSKKLRAHAESEEREIARKKAQQEFEASTLGALQRQIREALAAHGITGEDDLPLESLGWRARWIFDDHVAYNSSSVDIRTLCELADAIGTTPQELLFGEAKNEAAPSTAAPGAVWHRGDVEPPDGAQVVVFDGDGFCGAGVYQGGGELLGSVCSWNEVVLWTMHPEDDAAYVTTPAPAAVPVWHPYPQIKPDEGQTVLVAEGDGYYGVMIYRNGFWYLPESPDSEPVRPRVEFWSAELPPREV